jgi:site-specific recombinase XerD
VGGRSQPGLLAATRTHLELYRTSVEERGQAASTIDWRLSTACAFYRFAYIDGRIPANPAQYVGRPQVHPPGRRGLDRGELARFLYPSASTGTPPPWPGCRRLAQTAPARV